MTSLKKKSTVGFLWEFIGRISLQGVGFLVSIILARILTPEDFGLLAIITVFLHLSGVFLDFGFSTALIQRKDINEDHYSSVFFVNILMGVVISIIVFLSAPLISKIYDNILLERLIKVSSICFIIVAFGNVTRAKLRRDMNFKIISYTNVASAIISGVLALFMAFYGYGIWSLIAQMISNFLISNVLLFFASKIRIKFKLNTIALRELWGMSSRMFLSGIFDTILSNLDALIIGKLLNMSTLGYFNRSKSLENFTFRYTSSALESVLLPSLSKMQNDINRLKYVVIKLFHILSFISFYVCGLLLISSQEIVLILFSSKWEPSIIIFQILISFAFTTQINSLFNNALLATGNIKIFFRIDVIGKVLLFLNFGILLLFSLDIYLLCYGILKLITLGLGVFYVSKTLKIGKQLYFQMGKYIIFYVTTVLVVLFLKRNYPMNNFLNLIIYSFLYTFLFVLITWLFKMRGLKIIVGDYLNPLINKLITKLM